MSKIFFEHEKRPNEGKDHFYDERIPNEKNKGLEYAIRRTEERLNNDPNIDKNVFEQHLGDLRRRLEEAKKEK